MTTTIIENGQLVTSTTTEQDLRPKGPYYDSVIIVNCQVESGTLYFGVGQAGGSPVINGDTTYGSYASGESAKISVEPGKFNLRVVGSGTFIATW